MSVTLLAGLMFKVLFFGAMGFLMRKGGMIDDAFSKMLSSIMLLVIMPINIIASGNTAYNRDFSGNLLWAALFSVAYYLVGVAVLYPVSRRLRLTKDNQNLFFCMLLLANLGYIGFPIISELFGAEGGLYTTVTNVFFQFAVYLLATPLMGDKPTIKKIATNPGIIAPFVAILIFFSPFRLPGFVVETLQQAGGLMLPFSMIIIGASLTRVKFSTLWTDKHAWWVFIARQVAVPALFAVVMKAIGLAGVLPATLLILSSMPSAAINVILAETYDKDILFATRGTVISTLFMVISLPVWALVSVWLFF